jgi:hypothetical protein
MFSDRAKPGEKGVWMLSLVGLAPSLEVGGCFPDVYADGTGLDGFAEKGVAQTEVNDIHRKD